MLKTFFSLPFVNRSLVEKQLKSRYLSSMFNMYKKFNKDKVGDMDLDRYDHPELRV